MLFWNGIPSSTSIVVVVRSTATGTVTVTSGNHSGSADADTSVEDGFVSVTLSGLSADTLYEYTVTTPNDSATGQCRTFPDSGRALIAFGSCQADSNFQVGYTLAARNPHAFIHLGDESYNEAVGWPTVADSISEASHYAYRYAMRSAHQGKQYLMQRIPVGYIADDHDTYLDGFNNDLTGVAALSVNVKLNALRGYTLTEGEFTQTKTACCNTLNTYYKGQQNGDADAETDAFYFRFSVGDVEVFVLSQIFSSPAFLRDIPNIANDGMSPEQTAWLKSHLSSSTKTFKVILSPKAVDYATNVNDDSISRYGDIEPLKQWVHDNSASFSVPGGVVWGCGDYHSPGVFAAYNGIDGQTYDHFSLLACPIGRNGDVRDPGAWGVTTRWAISGDKINNNKYLVFGEFESFGEYLEARLMRLNGRPIWTGRIYAGENKLTYPGSLIATA